MVTFLLAHHVLELVLVLLSENACSFLPLRYQVITGCQVIKLVPQKVLSAFFEVDVVVTVEQVHDVLVDWNWIPANKDSFLLKWLDLIVPRVRSNVFNSVPLRGIWV